MADNRVELRAQKRIKEGLQAWIGKCDRELKANIDRIRVIEEEQRILKRQKYELAKILKVYPL